MARPPSPPRDADPGPMGSSTPTTPTLFKPTSLHPPGPTTPPPPSRTPDGIVPINDMAGPDSSGNDAMVPLFQSSSEEFRFLPGHPIATIGDNDEQVDTDDDS